jgi:hypothetical protein
MDGWSVIRPWRALGVLALAGLAVGCGHTQPMVQSDYFMGFHKNYIVGVGGMFDLNQFDYGVTVADELRQKRCFSEIRLTHNIADPACDYVFRGNFSFYKVGTKNGFHIFSIYFLLAPLLSGIPNVHVDGMSTLDLEVYSKGTLQKVYTYKDVFWDERSYLTVYPAPTLDRELRLLTRLFLRDFARDFFDYQREL